MSDAKATPQKPPKGKKLQFAILLVVLLGGAGGGFWFWQQSKAAAAEHGHESPPAKEEPAQVLGLEPFLVNLADAEASRFLRATVRLVVHGKGAAAEFEHSDVHKARLRSAVLELLTTQKSAALVTPEGKAALKEAIAARASEVLKVKVSDVLFTDFVVQF